MKIQQMSQTGKWIDCQNVDAQIDYVLEREVWFAPRQKREPMTTTQQVIDLLSTGKTIATGNNWFDRVRAIADTTPEPVVVTTVRCACGHTVAASLVMSASRGSSCPDCYDRLSD